MNRRNRFRLSNSLTAILIVVLFTLLAWLSVRYEFETDLTRNGRHSLSDASIHALAQLKKPLEITAYARDESNLRELIKTFVGKFQRHRSDIKLHFVNPDAVPDEVRELGINVNGELVIRYGTQTERVRTDNEQEFVNALLRLMRGGERWLAFLDGHGERHPVGKANHDLANWVAQLSYRGFKYRPLNLAETGVIPDNTSVLVIASPLVSVLPGEVEIINRYLSAGGSLLWLVDPGEENGLEAVADSLGVDFLPGVLIDSAGQLLGINDPTIVLTTPRLYPKHPITDDFALSVFFPKATAIEWSSKQGWDYQQVLQTANHTWLEKGALEGEVSFDSDLELQGPLTLGLGLERAISGNEESHQRVVIIGDGDFLSNTYVGNSGNMELGMRVINWLSADDQQINIPSIALDDATLEMPPLIIGIFGIIFLLVLPISLLGTGILIWLRRKKS